MLKPEVESLPKPLRQRLVDFAGTLHDDHCCCEEGEECQIFDALVSEIKAQIDLSKEEL